MNNIFFTADLHFGHKKIAQIAKNRPLDLCRDVALHDEWLLDKWQTTVGKKDIVYILGDLTFYNSANTRSLLEKLPGNKFMVLGNHDNSVNVHQNYFVRCAHIMDVVVKASTVESIPCDLRFSLCHYPLLTWNNKPQGAIMLHGHCHGAIDELNEQSPDLRLDVGVDGALAAKHGIFIPVQAIYEEVMLKTKGVSIDEYVRTSYASVPL